MNALVLMSFCLGNILGPLTFRDQDAPQYIPAKISVFVANAASIVLTLFLLFYYMWENKRRDKVMTGVPHRENVEFMDMTDKENMEFRVRNPGPLEIGIVVLTRVIVFVLIHETRQARLLGHVIYHVLT